MEIIRKDSYDEFKFGEHWDNDDFRIKTNHKSKYSPDFKGDCQDLFSVLYKRKWKFIKDYKENNELVKFIKSLQETEEYKMLRNLTVRNAGESFEAMKKLIETFNRECASDNSIKRRVKAREASKDAIEAAKKYSEIVDFCGVGVSEMDVFDPQSLSVVDRIKTVQKLLNNDFINKIVGMIGRMESTARHQIETKADRGENKLVGVEQGGNLSRILAHELIMLDQAEELFALRMMENMLMQFAMGGDKPQGFGPIIVCIDESGSMKGDKNIFAKSFLFGMYIVATRTKREFWVIRFAVDIIVQSIKAMRDMVKLMDMFMNGGGTNFEKPLQATVALIQGEGMKNTSLKSADMVFITDGKGFISERVLNLIKEEKKRISFKIISAMIYGARDMQYSVMDTAVDVLKQFSDVVYKITDIYKEKAFLEEAFSI